MFIQRKLLIQPNVCMYYVQYMRNLNVNFQDGSDFYALVKPVQFQQHENTQDIGMKTHLGNAWTQCAS